MAIDPTLLSVFSALAGTIVGGLASISTAVVTQRYQDRLQRVAREVTKRETIYSDFIATATKAFTQARLNDFAINEDAEQLVVLVNRIRLFAPDSVVREADEILRTIIRSALEASVDARQLAVESLSDGEANPLLAFSIACRRDLERVQAAGKP